MSTSDAGERPIKPPSDTDAERRSPALLELGDALSAALAEAEKFANQAATQAAIARMVADQRGETVSDGGAAAEGPSPDSAPPSPASPEAPRPAAAVGAAAPPATFQMGPNIRGMPTGDRQGVSTGAQQAQLDMVRQRASAEAESAARVGRELEAARADLKATRQRFARVAEQLEEAQRRCERMETELPAKASRHVLQTLLPALDVQTAVVRGLLADDTLGTNHRRALQMSVAEWERVLAVLGVGAFDTEGQRFDPIVHEAIANLPTSSEPPGTVLSQVGRGYLFEGRVLRPAQVVVAARPPAE